MGRSPRNHRPDLNGLLVIDKPLGTTSTSVCRHIRWVSGGAKVGHAGTLDPLATGVLVVCLGTATKAVSAIQAMGKQYVAEIDLSVCSATDDMEGELTPPAGGLPTLLPDLAAVEAALDGFRHKTFLQRPPAYSAAHIDGKRAYHLAREAAKISATPDFQLPKAKPVRVDEIDVAAYTWPMLTLDISCGKGTYIRSIARDLGAALAVGGMLRALRRTAIGPYAAIAATPLASAADALAEGHLLPTP